MGLKALIFDVDGTLAETEEVHREAFNQAFAGAGLDWHWSFAEYRDLLRITGGRERIAHFMDRQGMVFPDAGPSIIALHQAKNGLYAKLLALGSVTLRPGVARLIDDALRAGLRIAIATTTSRSNVEALIAATPLAHIPIAATVTGEDVTRKKPNPEAYVIALARLNLAASDCLAFEDSANGLRAALDAGIATVITPGLYTQGDDFSGALCVTTLDHFTLAQVNR